MKRRGFLGTLLGSASAVIAFPAAAGKNSNPLKGKRLFVRVFSPTKKGDRLICSTGEDGFIHGFIAKSGEAPHCIAEMDATFRFSDPVVNENGELTWIQVKGTPYSQVIVVSRL